MKKIIALILATIMVMLAVAACGGSGSTTTTTANATTTTDTTGTTSTTSTTQATTTTETVVIPDPVNVIVYYTMGENPVAINLATNESAGQLTLAEGAEFELVQGNFYVATYYNGASTALAQLGAALKTETLSIGLTNTRSADNPKNPGKVNGGSWWKTIGKSNFDTNMSIDTAALNEAMGTYTGIGEFGTLTVKAVGTNDFMTNDIMFLSSIDGEVYASEMNVKFAYVAYDGSTIATATNTEAKTPVANAADLLRYANSIGSGKEASYLADAWQAYLDNYGAPGSTTMCECELCQGAKSLQDHWQNEWLNTLVTRNYPSALANYNLIALDADALKVVLDNATAAFDAAVAANETVAALKAAAEAEGATDEAKKAYTDAIAADENLKALNAAVTAATTDYNNAVKGDENAETYTENYNKWKALFEAFNTAYAEAADLVLWDAEDLENSILYKELTAEGVDVEALARTYTYYYDAATDTYTIYVTSAKDANIRTSW